MCRIRCDQETVSVERLNVKRKQVHKGLLPFDVTRR